MTEGRDAVKGMCLEQQEEEGEEEGNGLGGRRVRGYTAGRGMRGYSALTNRERKERKGDVQQGVFDRRRKERKKYATAKGKEE